MSILNFPTKNYSKKIFFCTIVLFLCFVFYEKASFSQAEVPFIASSSSQSKLLTDFFTKTLQLGSNDEEVVVLKYMLSKDSLPESATLLNEMPLRYFGPQTQAAVISFQEKYKNEVLLPLGLSKGTGIVGAMTRKKLNAVLNSEKKAEKTAVSPTVTPQPSLFPSVTPNIFSFFKEIRDVRLFRTDKYQIAPGDTLILEGKGFSAEGNSVFFGTNEVKNVKSADSSRISVVVPATTPLGAIVLKVKTADGITSSVNPIVHIIVTSNPKLPPSIVSITPTSARTTDVLTITGLNFTAQNNTIITGFGTISGLASSNGTIMLDLNKFPSLSAVRVNPQLKNIAIPMWMYIQNENGISSKEFMFTVNNN